MHAAWSEQKFAQTAVGDDDFVYIMIDQCRRTIVLKFPSETCLHGIKALE